MTEPAQPTPEKRRNAWRWVSALLALIAAGLLVWALGVMSDRDDAQDDLATAKQELTSTQDELDSTQKQLDQAQKDLDEETSPDGSGVLAAGGLAAAKAVYDDLEKQLGTTEQDLADAQQDLEDATAQAEQAEQDAASAQKKAEQAGDKTEKAQAEADQAKADAKAAESKTTIAADCARAYVAAFGVLFEGDDPRAQAPDVRKQLEGITDDCRAALGDS